MTPSKSYPRRLAAIMFSDICGYSRLMGESEARALAVLARHDNIVNAAVAHHNGTIIKRMGDGFLAEFGSAVSAVECALAIQRKVRAENDRTPGIEQFQLRIGVHLGDVMVEGEDILGDGVNVASRIEPLAVPGGICISQDVYNLIQNKVEVEMVSIGAQQLKNIRRQIEIYRVLVAAADKTDAAGATVRDAPSAAERKRGVRGRRRLISAIIGVCCVVLFLAVAARVREQRRRVRDERAISGAIDGAGLLLKDGKAAEARAVLEKAAGAVRPQAPGLDRLRAEMETVKDAEAKARIHARYVALIQSVHKQDWDACVALADAETRKRIGPEGVRLRMQLLGRLAVLGKVTPDDIRIKDIELNRERDSAWVTPEIRRDGQWHVLKPGEWRQENGDWRLTISENPEWDKSAWRSRRSPEAMRQKGALKRLWRPELDGRRP